MVSMVTKMQSINHIDSDFHLFIYMNFKLLKPVLYPQAYV